MLSEKKLFLEDFWWLIEGRIAFSLIDNRSYEGYILEIMESTFIFSDANPFNFPNELDDIELNIEDIDINSFYYFDKKWINFRVT